MSQSQMYGTYHTDYLSGSNQQDSHEVGYSMDNGESHHQLPSYSDMSYVYPPEPKNTNVDDKIMSVLSAYASSSKPQENFEGSKINSSSDLDFLSHSQSDNTSVNHSGSSSSSYPPSTVQNQSNYAQPTSSGSSSTHTIVSTQPSYSQPDYSPQQRVSSPPVQYQQPVVHQPQQPVQSQQLVHQPQQPVQNQTIRPPVQVQQQQQPSHVQAPLTAQFQQQQQQQQQVDPRVHQAPAPLAQQPVQQASAQPQQVLHQYAQNQQNHQLSQQQQQLQQLLQHTQLAQAYFDKIMRFMENIDRRLTTLESMTHNIIRSQQEVQQMPISSSELHDARRRQEQLEADAEAAKKLQESFDTEYYSNSTSSRPSVSQQPRPSMMPTASAQECPICNVKMTLTELQGHIESCLERESSTNGPKKVEASDKKGFMERLFGRNPPPTNQPTNAPVKATSVPAKTVTPPANDKNTYPAYQPQYANPMQPPRATNQVPYMMVNPTTGQMMMPYPYYPPGPGYGQQR